MTIASMTGFARTVGAFGPYSWTVEVKSVNAKGLDLRLRIAPGFDRIEREVRTCLAHALARGTCFATLSVQRSGAAPQVRVNASVLAALIEAVAPIAKNAGLSPPTIDGLLGVRGIVEVVDGEEDETILAGACEGAFASFREAIDFLVLARRSEGAALRAILDEQVEAIAGLTRLADASPARRPEAIRARLSQSLSTLLEAERGFDENRLHQEAILMAAKADIREDLDRLTTHVGAVRELLRTGGPVGRKLDFLAQELAREANTLCAKANDVTLTAIGLDLRAQIEQFREQVQNIE
jgi:uncharacterized protein (TIGR00255 family)